MQDDHHENIAFLDFEASSLCEGSWPVEVGLSWIATDGKILTREWKIRKEPDWSEDAWSAASAKIHGISRASLEHAMAAGDVAQQLATAAEGMTVVSDAPKYDEYWLKCLFRAGSEETFSLGNFHSLAVSKFSEQELDWVYEELERIKPPHRAGPDSARLARAWRKGLQAGGRCFSENCRGAA